MISIQKESFNEIMRTIIKNYFYLIKNKIIFEIVKIINEFADNNREETCSTLRDTLGIIEIFVFHKAIKWLFIPSKFKLLIKLSSSKRIFIIPLVILYIL